MKNHQGFVFIELMFVVAIIGILAAIAIPAYQDYIVRTQVAEPILAVNEMRASINEFYLATGRFPKDNQEAGLADGKHYRGNYFIAAQVDNGAIHIQLDEMLKTHGQWLSLRPLKSELGITDLAWACGYASQHQASDLIGKDKTNVDTSVLPASCR